MRLLVLACLVFPVAAQAEVFSPPSRVTDVTMFPDSAAILRQAEFSIPAGSHRLVLRDLPMTDDVLSLRIRVEGAEAGAITFRESRVPPSGLPERPEVQAAKDRIDEVERRIEAVRDEVAAEKAKGEAARATLVFLEKLGNGELDLSGGSDAVATMSEAVGKQALAAHQTLLQSDIRAREAARALTDLNKDLADANQALEAVSGENEERMYLSIDLSADQATEGRVLLSYVAGWNSNWVPVYDVDLITGDTPRTDIRRAALIRQETGENWDNVQLTLSTLQLSDQVEAWDLRPWLRRIEDKQAKRRVQSEAAGSLAEPVLEAPVVVEEPGTMFAVDFDGPGVTYAYPEPVSLASGADVVKLNLGVVSMPAEVQAVAVPQYDDTAFLSATVRNRTGEPILPSSTAMLSVDGTLIGSHSMPAIPAGGEARLPFGPIDQLRIRSVNLETGEGEAGLLSKYSELRGHTRFEVENLSDRIWDVRVLGRVAYSQQDALEMTWEATPSPDETNVDDKRGILGWDVTVAPGKTETVEIKTRLTWPEDKILR